MVDIAMKNTMVPITMLMTSLGAPVVDWIAEPPYFNPPNKSPEKMHPMGFF